MWNEKIVLSASSRLVVAGGSPYTDVITKNNLILYDIQNTNAKRAENYYRWDIRLGVKHLISKKFAQEFIFEFPNITDRRNDWLPSIDPISEQVKFAKQQGFRFVLFYRFYF